MSSAMSTARAELEAVRVPRGGGLVFTSAGPYAVCRHWTRGSPNFDLIVANYAGAAGSASRSCATWYFERPGSKFQNLWFAMRTYPHIFEGYDAALLIAGTRSLAAAAL